MPISKKALIYSFVTLFLTILILLSPDYSNQSLIQIIFVLFTGIILTQWYTVIGLFTPWIAKKAQEDNKLEINDPQVEFHKGFGSIKLVFIVSILVSLYIGLVVFVLTPGYTINNFIAIFLYITVPTGLLFFRKWYTLFVSTIWIWFAIEWNVINDHLGNLEFEFLPADALIGLFALLWPLIMFGRHVPWYDWDIKKVHLKYANIGALASTIAVVPLGIAMNFLKFNLDTINNHEGFPNAVTMAIVIFLGIFVVQGLMEETLFRGIIFKHMYQQLQLQERDYNNKYRTLSYATILSAGILIISIPFWGIFFRGLANLIPLEIFSSIADRLGDLADPLGEHEGEAIAMFVGMPLWPFYLSIGITFSVIGILLYEKYNSPLITALWVQGMIFGFAHFEDWRYVMFSAFAGIFYGYTYFKTKNIAASALVHMGVDAVWALFLSY